MRRRLIGGLVIALVAALVALGAGRLGFVELVEEKLYDRRVRAAADPATARKDIAVVAIDELSVRRLEPAVGRWPWPRLVHATAIDYLKQAGVRLVVYDVLFTERDRRTGFEMAGQTWTGDESDSALADAVAAAGNVILPADVTFEGLVDASANRSDARTPYIAALPRFNLTGRFERRPVLTLPYPALAGATRALGHNLFALDPDGPVRRMLPFVRTDDRFVPSLSVAAVLTSEKLSPDDVTDTGRGLKFGPRDVPLITYEVPRSPADPAPSDDERFGRAVLVSFRGPAVLADGRSTTYAQFSFADILESSDQLANGEAPLIPPAALSGRIVVVGTTAAGLHDVFTVPFGEGARMPGPLIHAAAIDQLLSGRFVRPLGRWGTTALVVGLSFGLAFLFTFAPLRWGVGASITAAVATVMAAFALFRGGLWLPIAVPLIATTVAAFGGVAYQYFVEGREKRAVKRLFSRYLSRDVYEQVLANPALAELGGKRPRHDGALLGHAGLHDVHRERRARSDGRSTQRVLLAHGRRSSSPTAGRSTSSSATW